MRVTQGAFSYLPDLTDDEILAQLRYAMDKGWAISVELTDDPHPRNTYWEMWGLPMFELADASAALLEVNRCRQAFPNHYVRVNAYDATLGRQTTALDFVVQRPGEEPGFWIERQERADRSIAYTLHAYATNAPSGQRYSGT